MISAQNLQQLLSGSKKVLFLIIVLFWVGCNTPKKTPTKRTQAQNDKEKKDVVTPKVDTIVWKNKTNTESPPITNESDPISTDETDFINIGEIKSEYSVAIFLPFDNGNIDLNNKYVQYYAGMKLAIEEINEGNVNINFEIKDTEYIKGLKNNEVYDVVIAPNDKEIVNNLIEYGKTNKRLVISPWYTNSSSTEDNPYYLQLTPNVKEHFNKIAEHVSTHFSPNEVALVGLNTSIYTKWFSYFQEVGKAYRNDNESFIEHFVLDDSLALGEWVFGEPIEQGVKAFIIPNYSSRDEGHVYSTLRRLHAEKGLSNIYVYGMPLLKTSDRIGFDFYSNLNIRIAISEFVDPTELEAVAFREKYYDKYKDLASMNAFEGFDLVKFVTDMLSNYGTGFCTKIYGQKLDYIHQSYKILPVFKEDDIELNQINFFENKHLEIIEFSEGKFKKSN
jgi:hypothetical protein